MKREELVTDILNWDLTPGYSVVERCDGDWLADHGGGFAPISAVDDGDVFEICPEQIVKVGSHLEHDEFVAFVEAIRTWQRRTLGEFALRLAPDLIVAKFCQDFPDAGQLLSSVADRNGMDLVRFMGAVQL